MSRNAVKDTIKESLCRRALSHFGVGDLSSSFIQLAVLLSWRLAIVPRNVGELIVPGCLFRPIAEQRRRLICGLHGTNTRIVRRLGALLPLCGRVTGESAYLILEDGDARAQTRGPSP